MIHNTEPRRSVLGRKETTMTKEELIEALAVYFQIDEDIDGYDWNSGCTICGNDGEYRWLTLSNVVEALEIYCD